MTIDSARRKAPAVSLPTVADLIGTLKGMGIEPMIYGGWGLDVALGRQTRLHRDLDLFCRIEDYERLVAVLKGMSATAYTIPGIHVAVESPVPVDIVFLQGVGADVVTGVASTFEARVPGRGFDVWAEGAVDGYRLPLGCVELVAALSQRAKVEADRAQLPRLLERLDLDLLSEIQVDDIRYRSHDPRWRSLC